MVARPDRTELGCGEAPEVAQHRHILPRWIFKQLVLNGAGVLSSHAEFELMKKHVDFGLEILSEMNDIPKAALIPVLKHNEREDGSGYPRGLTGDHIHVFGKITAIADVFDAMTTDRVFRKALRSYDAFKEMLSMPLDRRLLTAFIELLGPEKPH